VIFVVIPLKMQKQLRIRFSLKTLLAACISIGSLLGWYVLRLHRQDAAIAMIENCGGAVGHFNEWVVIGVEEKPELPAEYARRTFLNDRDIQIVSLANDSISEEIINAIDSLPTVQLIQITGRCSQIEVEAIQKRFPEIEIQDMETLVRRVFAEPSAFLP
jgi:hypothetical protein